MSSIFTNKFHELVPGWEILMSPASLNVDVLEAMHDKNAPYGHLGHAIRVSQKLIHIIEPHCKHIQMTGAIRYLPLENIDTIELIALAKPIKDLLGQAIDVVGANKLSQWLSHPHDDIDDLDRLSFEDVFPTYRFKYKDYRFIITAVQTVSQLAIAQLIHSGPATFTTWLTSENHSNNSSGALPWGFNIAGYTLYDNNRKPVEVKHEHDVFKAIGYHYIHLIDRQDGNPTFWTSLKMEKIT